MVLVYLTSPEKNLCFLTNLLLLISFFLPEDLFISSLIIQILYPTAKIPSSTHLPQILLPATSPLTAWHSHWVLCSSEHLGSQTDRTVTILNHVREQREPSRDLPQQLNELPSKWLSALHVGSQLIGQNQSCDFIHLPRSQESNLPSLCPEESQNSWKEHKWLL